MTLEELKKRAKELSDGLRRIEQAADAHESKRMKAFREELKAETESMFGAQLKEAREAKEAARQAVLDEAERIALSGDGLPYPIGTKLYEWEPNRWFREWRLSGKVGVIEVITKDSQHPLRGQQAERGKVVIRHLKKDGSPSLNYTLASDWELQKWLPEGQSK